ncbi:hypothetical protein [Enterococcus sp. CWB-B31]|uniref:hypothetical protein n=1 Tax=Enterococcus sp. CWB-B31 TaxID=2885159 RepID=UPI001E5B53B0|nr:hypothetical protein [Enterococcus sp. CWB-B31]MCB5954633.1 hypothetical protein [Enterococcus sp. CWB-B31]
MKEEYIVIGPGSDYVKHIFSDIDNFEGGTLFATPVKDGNKLLTLVHHIHFSLAINRKLNLPFKRVWNNYYSLSQVKFDDSVQYYLVFTDISACRYSYKYLCELSRKKNVKLGISILNIMSAVGSLLKEKLELFDYIFSFDKKDSQKYGFIFWPLIYSSSPEVEKENCINRAFFVGNAKRRLDIIHGVFDQLSQLDIPSEFYVSKVSKDRQVYTQDPHFHYNQWLNYKDVMMETQRSNCVVEIVDDNQSGLTLRSAEAITMNKKILTNNESIKLSKFYDPKRIFIFKDPKEITLEFFNQNLEVDYQYDNSFSPEMLIKYMKQN